MPGLYIHIPYCVKKCEYCDFYSIATGSRPEPGKNVDHPEFIDALTAEFRSLPKAFQPETLFMGGGTPTELSDTDFARLLESIHQHVDLSCVEEWTCESNPGTLTSSKVEMLQAAGINRVSLGVQSFRAENLKFLGRIHTGDEAVAGYHLLREHGVRNINLDLIYGIPGGCQEWLADDLARMVELRPEHTSCYGLMYEPGTPLTRLRDRGTVREVDADEELAQYQQVRDTYRGAGYHHYEISNFAMPGRECRHNLLYWGAGEYIGCGPSAHSHWQGVRYGNVRSIRAYSNALLNGKSARSTEERLEPADKARESLIMALRRLDGVSHQSFQAETGFDYRTLCEPALRELTEMGLLIEEADHLRLTEKGVYISDAIFAELL